MAEIRTIRCGFPTLPVVVPVAAVEVPVAAVEVPVAAVEVPVAAVEVSVAAVEKYEQKQTLIVAKNNLNRGSLFRFLVRYL